MILDLHGGNNANTLARPALQRANADEETRIHTDRHHYAQLGHRREHSDLQRGECGAAASAALPGIGATGVGERAQAKFRVNAYFLSQLHRLAGSAESL